jgi:hypothetical protein
MPGNGVKVVYQPFSLQERMAPLAMMKEEYDKVNEGLAELGLSANQMAQYIDPDSQAGQALAQYNQLLDSTAGILSKEGLKGVSRTTLYNLKRAYQSQIAPINEGAKNYAALQAQIKEMQWKDPTIMVSDMPSLDDYIKNPNRLPNVLSGAKLMEEGATAALTLPGVTYQQLLSYANGNADAIPGLNAAAERIAKNYGVSTEEGLAWIQRGIHAGLGQRTTTWETAKQKADYEFDQAMAKERYEQQQQNARHYSTVAQNQQALIANMQREGWGWDPSLNNGRGGFYQDENTLARARQAALASSGYDPNTPLTPGTGSTTRGRNPSVETEREDFSTDTRGVDQNGASVNGSSVPVGSTQVFPYSENSQLTAGEKANILRLAGVDISGARDASSRRERYVESELDRLLEEHRREVDRYEYHRTGTSQMWRVHKSKNENIPIVTPPTVARDSTRTRDASQEFGVTKRR